jgi:hypothetical protein
MGEKDKDRDREYSKYYLLGFLTGVGLTWAVCSLLGCF